MTAMSKNTVKPVPPAALVERCPTLRRRRRQAVVLLAAAVAFAFAETAAFGWNAQAESLAEKACDAIAVAAILAACVMLVVAEAVELHLVSIAELHEARRKDLQ